VEKVDGKKFARIFHEREREKCYCTKISRIFAKGISFHATARARAQEGRRMRKELRKKKRGGKEN